VLEKDGLATAEYREMAKENFSRVFSYLAEDGSNYEGVTYWRYGGMWLFVYAHLLKVEEGLDYFKTSDYLKNTFYYRLYQATGDLKQQLNFGDCHDRYSSHTACVYYKTAAEYGDGVAQRLGNLASDDFLMEEAKNSKVKPGILPEAVFEYLWYDPEVEEKEFDGLPLSRYFEDLGLLTIRDSWSWDAKVLTIKCGCPGGRKQWEKGWEIYETEGIRCLSLSHHHPDNLSYIFVKGNQYLTCEDGYNRNIMPDNHNVLLVDGTYTDVSDVNDVYMSSVRARKDQDPGFDPRSYKGEVTFFKQDGGLTLYRGENHGIYPAEFGMQEVSRFLLTDGLEFWVFADIFRSEKEHTCQIVSNTDMEACGEKGRFVYDLGGRPVFYTVFSDKEIRHKTYVQQVESVMTTQEPDKVCRTSIQTLMTESCDKVKEQIFYECFSFDEETRVGFDHGTLTVKHGSKTYEIKAGPRNGTQQTPMEVRILGENGKEVTYEVCK